MSFNEKLLNKDIKSMSKEELSAFCASVREYIIDSVSRNGGHLASNLGVVELTFALHRVFSFPEDKLIFDVGHQSYVHKILSGRSEGFAMLRNEGGVSGFQLRDESEYDFFGGGHSGTAISAALGFAEAERLNGGNRYAVAVVGDGSFTNGMVYEALNNASKDGLRLVIIINDNEMSISRNVGGMSRYFGRLRTSVKYYRFKRKFKTGITKLKVIGKPLSAISRFIKNSVKRMVFQKNMFENLGIDYIGTVDGHDLPKLEAMLTEAKLLGSPVVVHVCTKKGKGYSFAEENPSIYHGVSPFDKTKGVNFDNVENNSFSECFGRKLVEIAEKDENVVAITAAMCEGTGLSLFRSKYPQRFFDVGIAEEHAVTFAGGLSAAGKIPVFSVYSSFLQRSYDQIIHDLAIQDLHAVIAVDRAGFVANDGVTHQGILDCAFLSEIPGVTLYTPETFEDAEKMLEEAIYSKGLSVVRYPRGRETNYPHESFKEYDDMRVAEYGTGKKVTFITYGREAENVYYAAQKLSGSLCVKIIILKKVKPLDYDKLSVLCSDSEAVIFCEEGIKSGGVSENIVAHLALDGGHMPKMKIIAVEEVFPHHASLDVLYKSYRLDSDSLVEEMLNTLQ